ncbi:MAG: hypothetical protein IKO89_02695 [Bacteroidales bacterium]|nr:hypothetical protein [Bacteroidales bacterium]
MKKILFTILLCSVFFTLSAQSRKQVQEYYYWVNQAELAICDDNLQLADSLYTRAFSIKEPLAREMRTAYWVAVQTENNEIILQIAKCRIELGDEGLANSYQYMSPHFDTVVYQQLLDIEAQTIKTYCVKFDTILEHIIERDQRYRIQGMGRSPEQFALDDENRKLIKQFYREYPDFNEYVAGFYYMGMLGVVLLHAVQTDHYDLQPLLRKKVMAGIFPAEKYMEFEAWWEDVHPGKEHHYGSGLNNIYYIGNTLFVEQPDNLKQIDKNRKKLGLAETWQDAVKKRVWECEHNTYYITGSRQSRIYGDEEDDAAEAAKMEREIDAEHAKGDFHRMYYEKGSKASK